MNTELMSYSTNMATEFMQYSPMLAQTVRIFAHREPAWAKHLVGGALVLR